MRFVCSLNDNRAGVRRSLYSLKLFIDSNRLIIFGIQFGIQNINSYICVESKISKYGSYK